MTNWQFYVKAEEHTHPPIDCFQAVLALGFGENSKYKFATYMEEKKGWVSEDGALMRIDKCCYSRILPPISVVSQEVVKCGLCVITNGYCNCDYEDDGYCFNAPKNYVCKYMMKSHEHTVR